MWKFEDGFEDSPDSSLSALKRDFSLALSAPWTGGKIPVGIPTFFPMESVHSKKPKKQNIFTSFDCRLLNFENGYYVK